MSIDEVPESSDEPLAVNVSLAENGETIMRREVRLDAVPSSRDMADIRWYLEEFPNHPFDPAPTLAGDAQRRMQEIGGALFASLCSAVDDQRFRHALGPGLDATTIEIRGMSGRVPWELLRDPETGRIPAVDAERMVRLVPGPAREAPQVGRDARMLLVVSRPMGTLDVGFQSVARPLLNTLASTGAFQITVLRPPTHDALRTALTMAKGQGRPFELVHFDGHGLLEGGTGRLVFEGERRGSQADLVPGATLGVELAAAGVRIAVLNACRSADVGPPTTTHALRSLAEELVLAGVSSAVAMQYDVRVDTAARFVVPLYASLAAGRPAGTSVTQARRALHRAMEAARERGAVPTIDDWYVPAVFEAEQVATVQTLGPARKRSRPTSTESTAFYGRDDVLLQLDRAFGETSSIVLTGMAGSGKTATAREFARWYETTGGINGDVVEVEIGSDLGQPHARVLEALGGSLEAALARRLGLLVIDGINAPPPEERDLLNELFARLTEQGARILLTANGAFWVNGAEELRLGPLTVGDMVDILADQLMEPLDEAALASWRPVIDLADGNPLALRVVTEWADARANQSPGAHRALVDDILGGDGPPLPALARRPLERLARHLLDPEDWQLLLVLLHRQRYVDINELLSLGKPDTPNRLAELAEVSGQQWAKLFTLLSAAGLMWQAHNTYFELHPLLPCVIADGSADIRDAKRTREIERSFAFIMHSVGMSISAEHEEGSNHDRNLQWALSEEHNLRHAHSLALRREWWDLATGPLRGLRVGYTATGRRLEWSAVVDQTAEHAMAADGRALPGREALWAQVAAWRRDIALTDRTFREARRWAERLVEYWRDQGSSYHLALALLNLALPARELNDPTCLNYLAEAETLLAEEDESARPLLAGIHYHLGLSYQELSEVGDLRQAFEEYGASLELQHPQDDLRRAKCISQQGEVALRSALAALPSQEGQALSDMARQLTMRALELFPTTALEDRAVVQERLGRIARLHEQFDGALSYDMAARACHERTGDVSGQARCRLNVALDLQGLGRLEDARVYAFAAEAVFRSLGERGYEGREFARRVCDELVSGS